MHFNENKLWVGCTKKIIKWAQNLLQNRIGFYIIINSVIGWHFQIMINACILNFSLALAEALTIKV